MKTLKNFEFLLLGLIISGQLCCEQLCDAISAADLIIEDISAKHSNSLEDGVVYEIVHLSLNTILGIACPELGCEGAEVAGNHKYTQNIHYSENYPADWGEPIDSYDFSNGGIKPCANAQNSAIYKFLVDGYYLIEGIVDTYNSVAERNEENINLNSDFDKKKNKGVPEKVMIIHINNGLKAVKNDSVKYVERIETSTTYLNN